MRKLSPQPPPSVNLDKLSRRELEIFRHLGRGLSTKEIAAAVRISEHTVETHRKNIASKLGLRASALIRHAALHDLLAGAGGA